MRRSYLVFLLLVFLLVPGKFAARAATRVDAEKIVKKVDELYRSNSSFSVVEMEIVTPHWKRTLKMNVWTLGMEKTFIRILEPKKERGIATLRIGNEMWNFLPKTNKVIKVPPSMMMSSWMGSDFTNDDLVKEFTFFKDYQFELIEPEEPEEGLVYIKCIPKEGVPVVWGYIVIAVQESSSIPVWQRFYDEKGKLMRELFYREVKKFGDREVPSVMELVPTTKKGNRTVVRYLKAQFNVKISDGIFTLRNLRSRF